MKNSLCESAFFDIYQKMVLYSNSPQTTHWDKTHFFLSKKWILGAKIHILHFLKTWLCFAFSVKIQISNTDKFSSKSNFRTKYWLLPQCVTTICVPKSPYRSTSFLVSFACMHEAFYGCFLMWFGFTMSILITQPLELKKRSNHHPFICIRYSALLKIFEMMAWIVL